MIPSALAADLADGLDVDGFARRCGFARLDDWQRALLESTAPRYALACHRQAGKSSMAALLALRAMLAAPDVLVVALAHRLPSAAELKRKLATFHRRMGAPIPAVGDAALSFELANRSRFVCTAGSDEGGRSWSAPAIIILDECARVPAEACEALLATQATVPHARCIIMSTPRGRVDADGRPNWFAAQFENADPLAWVRTRVVADDCARIDPDWLARERARIGPMLYASEYLVDFDAGGPEDGALDPALLRRALSATVAPLALQLPFAMPMFGARTLPPAPIEAPIEAVA